MRRRRKWNRYRLLPGGLAEIELTQGLWTLVDADQLQRLLGYKWHVHRCKYHVYAVTFVGRRGVPMHRFLLGHDEPHTDHINGDGLDNRRANLRPATASQNGGGQRKLRARKTSRYRGVSYHGQCTRRPWTASIMKDRAQYRQQFATEAEAAAWYDHKARELFGEFAVQNFPMPATLQ